MNCLECQVLLQKRLDGERLAPSTGLEQHLSQCLTCRELHAGVSCLLDGLNRLPRPKPADGFAQSMVAQVLHDRVRRREKMRRRVLVTVALAASVLLMLFAAYYLLPPTHHEEPQPKQQLVEQPKKREIVPAKEEPKHAKKAEQPHALAALTKRWADTTRDHAKVVLAATNLEAVEKMPPVDELPDNPNVREVSEGVLAVTGNARKAFDFFARELPMPEN